MFNTLVGTIRIGLAAAMVLSVSAAFVGNGTQAAFVAQTTNPNNVFQAGTLKFTASSNTALFNVQAGGTPATGQTGNSSSTHPVVGTTYSLNPELTATVVSDSRIDLSWTALPNGNPITEIKRCAWVDAFTSCSPSTTIHTYTFPGNSTVPGSFSDTTVTGAASGTRYSYLVNTSNGFFQAIPSASSSFSTPLKPGDIVSNVLTLQQTGTLLQPIRLTLAPAAGGLNTFAAGSCDASNDLPGNPCGVVPLSNALQIAIWRDGSTCVYPISGLGDGGAPCGYAAFGDGNTTTPGIATLLSDGNLIASPADALSHPLSISLRLPAGTDNSVQGYTTEFSMTWTATAGS